MTVIISLRDAAGVEVFGEEISDIAHQEPLDELLPRVSEMFADTAHEFCLRDGWTMSIAHPEFQDGGKIFTHEETLQMAGMTAEA